jgi:hypothetical protein
LWEKFEGVWEIFEGVWEIFENCGEKKENCGGKKHVIMLNKTDQSKNDIKYIIDPAIGQITLLVKLLYWSNYFIECHSHNNYNI